MLRGPLIIAVACIARVASRIVRGVGQEKRADDHRGRTPPRKIRARFLGYKLTSLTCSCVNPGMSALLGPENDPRNGRRNVWASVVL
jgi:hypothetical protein